MRSTETRFDDTSRIDINYVCSFDLCVYTLIFPYRHFVLDNNDMEVFLKYSFIFSKSYRIRGLYNLLDLYRQEYE